MYIKQNIVHNICDPTRTDNNCPYCVNGKRSLSTTAYVILSILFIKQ